MKLGTLVLFSAAASHATGGIMKGRVLPFDLGVVSAEGATVLYFRIVEFGFTFGDGPYRGRPGYKLSELPQFCCYGGYESYKFQPTEREYHLLMAGEPVALESESP